MTTSLSEIVAAEEEIEHLCDGPLTPFVLIGRATDLAAKGEHSADAVANALHTCLQRLSPERPGCTPSLLEACEDAVSGFDLVFSNVTPAQATSLARTMNVLALAIADAKRPKSTTFTVELHGDDEFGRPAHATVLANKYPREMGAGEAEFGGGLCRVISEELRIPVTDRDYVAFQPRCSGEVTR